MAKRLATSGKVRLASLVRNAKLPKWGVVENGQLIWVGRADRFHDTKWAAQARATWFRGPGEVHDAKVVRLKGTVPYTIAK